MKAVITAQFDSHIMSQLKEQMEVIHTGWGVTEVVLTPDELIEYLKDADFLITEIEKCSKEVIESCPNLKFIGDCRNNPVNIDVKEASKRNIPVVYAPGRNAQAVAEMTLAMMVMLARKMGNALVDVRDGKWIPSARFSYLEYKGVELKGKTVGIAGLGEIGKLVMHLCLAFGMEVIVFDPYLEQNKEKYPDVTFVSLRDMLSQSDFVTLHVPDTPETMGMIGENELMAMKSSAYLINTARGRHVDQDALYEALANGKIAGAALDVFYKEPLPLDHKFFELENILLMPHIGGATYDVITNHSKIMYDQIQNLLNGQPLSYLKNPEIYSIQH